MLNGLRILSHLPLRQHLNIIDIVGWSITTDNENLEPLLIVEATPLGDLSSFWARGSSLNLVVRRLYALHESRLVHGDGKSAN